ncbi:MAG TPA: hypothetical protein VKA38_10310 [Draconibacterium sp.]|nr:hypothetical protein [Draconibacterium sp.]
MSYKEYQKTEHTEPYVWQLKSISGELLYFGSRHSFNPEDSQFNKLKTFFKDFSPDIVYTEGFPADVSSISNKEAIQKYGEFGLTWKLAGEANIEVYSLEPNRKKEIGYLQNKNWSNEQIILFYTLRQVAQSHQQQVDIDLNKILPQYLSSLKQRFGLTGPLTLHEFEQVVIRLLPDAEDWKEIPASYFYPGPQKPEHFTNQIATDSNQFRDKYHTEQIVKAVKGNNRVFVVAGSAHAVMQEPAIRALLFH